MIYEVIVRTEPEETAYLFLSYEDVLNIFIDRLLSDEQYPLTIRRRCCGSVNEHTMPVETCCRIRELAGVAGENAAKDIKKLRIDLDTAVNNWYIKGEISVSDLGLIKPFDSCGTDPE